MRTRVWLMTVAVLVLGAASGCHRFCERWCDRDRDYHDRGRCPPGCAPACPPGCAPDGYSRYIAPAGSFAPTDCR